MIEQGEEDAAPSPQRRGSRLGRRSTEDGWRCRAIIGLIEEARASRDMTEEERRLLAYARSRVGWKREVWRWSEWEDRELRLFLAKRRHTGRPKPFQRDDQVRLLADRLGRSYMAVHRRLERLRKMSRGKCSSAGKAR